MGARRPLAYHSVKEEEAAPKRVTESILSLWRGRHTTRAEPVREANAADIFDT